MCKVYSKCIFLFILIVLGLLADVIGLSSELMCKPMISDSTPNKGGFRQIECETSTCANVYILQYEKRGVKSADQWTPVFKSMNNTHHALDTGTKYSLRDRANYVSFSTKTLLYIKPLKLEDHGKWRCVVYDNGYQKYVSRGLDVNIFEPAMVLIPIHATIVTTDVDVALTLNCSGSGLTPSLTWRKDGETIFNNDTRYFITVACNGTNCEGSLTIKPVDCINIHIYTGVYSCVISLEPPYLSSQGSPDMIVEAPMSICDDGPYHSIIGSLSGMCVMSIFISMIIAIVRWRRYSAKEHTNPQGQKLLILKSSYSIVEGSVLSKYYKLQNIVVIDFGTTYSGYAHNLNHQEKKLTNKVWVDNEGNRSNKVPTCVLTEGKNDQFVAFGFAAQRRLTYGDDDVYGSVLESSGLIDTLPELAITKQFHFYDQFKNVLDGDKEIGSHIKVTAFDGHECKVSKIFTMVLTYFKDDILQHIPTNFQGDKILDTGEIQWIISVPMTWSEAAKEFMRQCAVGAGIIHDYNSEKLMIVLETETASLDCTFCHLSDNFPGSRLVKGKQRNQSI